MAIISGTTLKNAYTSMANYAIKYIPSVTFDGKTSNRIISWAGKAISSPENRLILGVSALMSQPFIDLYNKRVDEETRKVSAARTVAKIIAGTLTGVAIRYGCIKAIDTFANLPSQIASGVKNPRLRTLLTPTDGLNGVLKDLKKYKEGMGTLLSLFVMLFTNFLIDAPLTKYLTNKFVDRIHKKDALKHSAAQNIQEKKEVSYDA